MSLTKFAPEDIIPVVIHVLSFSAVKFAEYGYLSIVENEIPDLKGMDEEDIDPALYFELLAASDDEVSKALLKCIKYIDEAINTLRIMYAIDLDELYSDERIYLIADDLYADLYFHADYIIEDDVDAAIMELPFTAANTFFYLCRLIMNGAVDVELALDEGLYGTGAEEFEFMDTSNPNIGIIHNLADQLLIMNKEIFEIYGKKRDNTN